MILTNALKNWSSRSLVLLCLIVAGEAVFLLPFVIARIFRPTLLDVFGISNLQLGIAFSGYGIVAFVSYFLGGPLADRFSARKLMSFALLITATGGIIYANIPNLSILIPLFGFWGLSTILLFWAALIRATREWGGDNQQGFAYGLLDGGRGLVAAVLASISVFIFAKILPLDIELASIEDKRIALGQIIWFFTGLTFAISILVWVVIPDSKSLIESKSKIGWDTGGIREVIKMPGIWLNAIIVLCAYVGYKCTDDFSLYTRDAFGFNDIEAANFGTISYWTRPFVAIIAGIIADRINSSLVVIFGFIIMMFGSLAIASGILNADAYYFLVIIIVATSVGIYSLRAVYFALLQEARVPIVIAGSAIGIVSVIGFTPDIFMGPLMGYLTDSSPGELGHQHLFAVLGVFSLIGLIASILLRKRIVMEI